MLTRENVPAIIIDSLDNYRDKKWEPGGFLTAVLSNDLQDAVARADEHNIRIIPDIVYVLYNDYPSGMWGSREAVREWLNS